MFMPMENAITLGAVVGKYLGWCGRHRSARTLEWYEGHLRGFLAHLGGRASMPAAALRPYHVAEWVDGKEGWGATYRRGAVVAVQRCLNWAEQMGHIDASPVKKVSKPPASRRENPMTPGDYRALLGLLPEGDPFRDLLTFVWHTGCRPQEARHVEPRHVHLERGLIVIPREEAKGGRHPRVIHLHGPALEVARRLTAIGERGSCSATRGAGRGAGTASATGWPGCQRGWGSGWRCTTRGTASPPGSWCRGTTT
jgi:integrase